MQAGDLVGVETVEVEMEGVVRVEVSVGVETVAAARAKAVEVKVVEAMVHLDSILYIYHRSYRIV